MAWIESHTVLIRHRKLKELAHALRLKDVYVMGHLHALWYAALEQQEDGDLSGWTDGFIAASACYTGDAPQFVRLLQTHGWLDGKVLHDWLDYAGKYLTKKYHSSNRARLAEIWSKHGRSYGTGNSQEVFRKQKVTLPNQPNLPTTSSSANADVSPDIAAKPQTSPYSPEFELFWKDYPRKVGKGAAYARWRSKSPPLDAVLAALKVQKRCEQWQDMSLIPHPETWLNQRRWDDDPAAYAPPKDKAADNYAYEEAEAVSRARRTEHDT